MKKIDFKVAGKKYCYRVPEKWSEVTAEQFKLYVEADGFVDLDFVRRLISLDDVVSVNLSISDWWWLVNEFEWMKSTDDIGKLFIEDVTMPDGTVCYGYNPDFSDITWEEWTFADTYASAGRWNVVAAVLYRPERKKWDRESDRRIPFTKYGTEKRMDQMAKLDKLTLKAIQVNYLILRKRLTDHYIHLFYDHVDEVEEGKKAEKQHTDWLQLIRNMMGDNFYEESKYLQLSVPSVLFQLERRVKEAKENGKR